MSICVVVADSSKARFLIAESIDSPLLDQRDFVHPESRLREQDLVTDGAGSGSDSGGHGKHSMGHEKTALQKQAADFAQELGREIEKLRAAGGLYRIYLVAPPKFLGLLRTQITKSCAALVADEITKDLVKHSIDDIRSHLPRRL